MTDNKTIDLFIKHVRSVAKQYDVRVFLVNKKKVKLGKDNYCSGYFTQTPIPKIVVAVDIPVANWLPILVHEFCHLLQYLDNDPTWTNLDIHDTDSCTEFQDWLEGNDDIHEELVTYHMRRIVEMEFNCEKRAVEKIKEFNLPIDIDDYIQKSNTYVWFYSGVRQERKWNGRNGISVFSIKEIVDFCPKTWVTDPLNPPKEFIDLLIKYYF